MYTVHASNSRYAQGNCCLLAVVLRTIAVIFYSYIYKKIPYSYRDKNKDKEDPYSYRDVIAL